MKKTNIKLMSTILTIALSGSGVCFTSCAPEEKENVKHENYSTLGGTSNIDKILNESNVKYLIIELQNYGVICDYSENIGSLEVSSIAGYDFSNMPDRFYTLLNDLLEYTSVNHLCCFSKELSTNLDLNKIDLENIKRLGLFGNDNIINYINNYQPAVDSLCILLDETSLLTNKLNLNIQGIEDVTILSGNSNIIELGDINFFGVKESKLTLSGIAVTNNTSFNCSNVKVILKGTIKDSISLASLKNVIFVYYDNETDKSISYNPNKNNLEAIVQKINVTNGIKGLKKGNM